MKQKFFHMYGKAVDKNGEQHIITIVGKLTQETVNMTESEDVTVLINNKKESNGLLIYDVPSKVRKLKYAFSICHPHDIENFDIEKGVEIAKKRIEKQPLGELETKLKTTLCDDQVKLILFGELNYIINHIDKFIEHL